MYHPHTVDNVVCLISWAVLTGKNKIVIMGPLENSVNTALPVGHCTVNKYAIKKSTL